MLLRGSSVNDVPASLRKHPGFHCRKEIEYVVDVPVYRETGYSIYFLERPRLDDFDISLSVFS